jgi:hypothetical protein
MAAIATQNDGQKVEKSPSTPGQIPPLTCSSVRQFPIHGPGPGRTSCNAERRAAIAIAGIGYVWGANQFPMSQSAASPNSRRVGTERITMGIATGLRFRDRVSGHQVSSRLAAIRAIVELADDEEDRDVAVDELLILGVSRQELTVAMFDDPAESASDAGVQGRRAG